MIRLLVAHRYPLIRDGIRAFTLESDDVEVVGETDHSADVVSLATALNPDVAICDINLGEGGGIDVTRNLRLHVPNTWVILLAKHEDEESLFKAVKSGASAYVLDDTDREPFLDTVRRVAHGEHLIDEDILTHPAIASKVLSQFNTLAEETKEREPIFAPLSPREIEILEQISHGNSNKQIARILRISDQTVKNHITSILKKLAVNDRTEAVVYSLRHGWIKMEALS
jgi:DNA-binding NarL/FixJ family response regulator